MGELVDECVREGAIPIEIRRRVSPNFPLPPPPPAPPGGPLFPVLGLVKNVCDWVGFLVPASVRATAVDVCVIDMVCAKLCVMLVLEKELCVCPLASESSTSIAETFPMGQ